MSDISLPKPVDVNPYYGESCLSGSSIEQDFKENPDRLFGQECPRLALQKEQPEHRIIIMLKAQGKSNKEIAEIVRYSPVQVGTILRQPWARERLVRELKLAGRDVIADILAGAAQDSVFTLIEERDNETAKPSDRISAANSLLDRFLGKPTMRVETDNVHRNITGDVAELDRELRLLEEEEKRLVGRN